MSETIFALATAPGRSAVAVMRLSGPRAEFAVRALTGRPLKARRASVRRLRSPTDGAVIDQAMVLWSPAPASYTGEDCAELQVHGGAAVIDALTDALLGLGLRPADPGEFTRRAFENGKLDLAQAEAVADLVDAETEAQRRQALGQLDGSLGQRYGRLREALTEALAHLEAAVDFPDEDLPEAVAASARPAILAAAAELEAALAEGARGERVREGFRVAVIGAPNAGKSSLFNALVQRDAAIVTARPGTTRDVIETTLTLAGYRVLIADTAGLREAGETIEAEGVRRAEAWAASADLRLLVVDRASACGGWREMKALAQIGDLCILNKSDLDEGADGEEASAWATSRGLTTVSACATADAGGLGLREAITSAVVVALSGGEFPAAT
ncbi:MAG TPA: tRNA uridine-5-carboxymethylaminomethyl(34) synthesis GTPase MnmE, partial [Caulobacteraceae bacterium]|nr:tRNA uridine-5-carboxymethylaminomethyl(34) synthesis GTPase MnmE [Caulobacteraceae bacterium]